ncbi:MAG: hypothetical protein Kow00127_24410 [Bacteroidales bacterium]
MKLEIVKLSFTGPLVLTSRRPGETVDRVTMLHSDMLKAALVSAAARSHTPGLAEKINNTIIVSSAWPWVGETCFFPKPYLTIQLAPEEEFDTGLAKEIKKVAFLDQGLFEKVIASRTVDKREIGKLHEGLLWYEKGRGPEPDTELYFTTVEEHVALGVKPMIGAEEKGDPYYVSRTWIRGRRRVKPGITEDISAGFWFAWQGGERDELAAALDLLGNEGVGADRTFGNGRFTWQFDTLEINLPEKPNGFVTLSKYVPSREEAAEELTVKGRYRITLREGFMSGALDETKRGWQRLPLWMIDEGAVLPLKKPPVGLHVPVTRNEKLIGHPVYRDGRAVVVPVLADFIHDQM